MNFQFQKIILQAEKASRLQGEERQSNFSKEFYMQHITKQFLQDSKGRTFDQDGGVGIYFTSLYNQMKDNKKLKNKQYPELPEN